MKKGFLELGEKSFDAELNKFMPQLPSNLPKSYVQFLKKHNGANGDLPIQPFCFELWQIDDLVQANQDYEIQKYLPNYFGIGGNGGEEFFALNLETSKVFAIPLIGMEEKDAWLVAKSFEDFENIMGFTNEIE